MQITWLNYKTVLPESLWQQFRSMCGSSRSQFTPIIYADKKLRWANADEQ